jgi:hypothetical protein
VSISLGSTALLQLQATYRAIIGTLVRYEATMSHAVPDGASLTLVRGYEPQTS